MADKVERADLGRLEILAGRLSISRHSPRDSAEDSAAIMRIVPRFRALAAELDEWKQKHGYEAGRAAGYQSRVEDAGKRDDWLRLQLDGLIEDADAVALTTGLALARSVASNLRDARAALAAGETPQ